MILKEGPGIKGENGGPQKVLIWATDGGELIKGWKEESC